jgi:transglutaminase-like putative cysteine protease
VLIGSEAGEPDGQVRPRDLATAAATAVAVAAAAMPVTAIYAPGPLPVLLCVVAGVGVALTAGLRAARLSALVTICAGLLVLGATIVALAVWLPRSDGSLLLVTAAAVSHSGAQILTSAVPIPVNLDSVALPVCATWLAAAGAATALRSRRPPLAALPPVALFVGAVALVGPIPSVAYGYTAALVAALVALLGAQSQLRAGRSVVLGITAVAVLLVGATVALGPRLVDQVHRQPPDPRAHVVPPYRAPDEISPLSRLAGWAVEPDQPLLAVHTDRPTRLRWVTFSEFTGITWLPADSYRAAGALLPARTITVPGTTVRQEISVLELTGGWLPVPDGTSEVRGVRVAVDEGATTVAAPDGLRPDLRYTLTALPPEWPRERLAAARLPSSAQYDRYRTLPPGAPPRLAEVAQTAGGGSASPYEQAIRLSAYLREQYRFDPSAPGGNGYPSMDRFLIRPVAQGGGRGTSEQFATAFAILARALGMPARVVVGFDPGQPEGEGRYLIRARDARAWAEVYLDGLGWVSFDPTPSVVDPRQPPKLGDTVEPLPTETPDSAPTPVATEAPAPAASAPASAPRPEDPAGIGAFDLSLAVLVVLLVLGLATVPVLRVRRRRARLDHTDPTARVLGAWSELRDGLRMVGRGPAGALVVAEVASLTAETVGVRSRPQAELVAGAVNAVGFGGAVPGEPEARQVVVAVRDLLGEIFRQAGWVRRWTWWLDPRPLWWRR